MLCCMERRCARTTRDVPACMARPRLQKTLVKGRAALQVEALDEGATAVPLLGALLRGIEAQLRKSCDTDAGGCGARSEIELSLTRAPPAVFTLQLAWESQQESAANIRAMLAAVQEARPAAPDSVSLCRPCRPLRASLHQHAILPVTAAHVSAGCTVCRLQWVSRQPLVWCVATR